MEPETYVDRMGTGWPSDASTGAMPLMMSLRRRTFDGFTRVECVTPSDVKVASSNGEHKFTVYMSDDERRELAAVLLAGLEPA